MLSLKGLYFYFLAIKITTAKFLQKIYFTTNFYNSSLKSRVPKQFYFYPNPFLLSSFSNYKNFSLKIENIDPETLWVQQSSKKDEKNLHDYFWLNLIGTVVVILIAIILQIFLKLTGGKVSI